DAIVLKAGKDADGLRVNRSTENVTVTNCIVHHGSSAVTLGSEMSGSIRNVVVDNMSINRCRATVGFEKMPPVMINIEGLPEMPISGLRIANIIASGK